MNITFIHFEDINEEYENIIESLDNQEIYLYEWEVIMLAPVEVLSDTSDSDIVFEVDNPLISCLRLNHHDNRWYRAQVNNRDIAVGVKYRS